MNRPNPTRPDSDFVGTAGVGTVAVGIVGVGIAAVGTTACTQKSQIFDCSVSKFFNMKVE